MRDGGGDASKHEAAPVPGGTLLFPAGMMADAASGVLVVADTGNHRLVVASLEGRIRSVIGDGWPGLLDGRGERARPRSPRGMAMLPDGRMAVADTGNHVVRVVNMATGAVGTVAGTGVQARRRLGAGLRGFPKPG